MRLFATRDRNAGSTDRTTSSHGGRILDLINITLLLLINVECPNNPFNQLDALLNDGDEVLILPAVTGG